jgi:hypothetical protein
VCVCVCVCVCLWGGITKTSPFFVWSVRIFSGQNSGMQLKIKIKYHPITPLRFVTFHAMNHDIFVWEIVSMRSSTLMAYSSFDKQKSCWDVFEKPAKNRSFFSNQPNQQFSYRWCRSPVICIIELFSAAGTSPELRKTLRSSSSQWQKPMRKESLLTFPLLPLFIFTWSTSTSDSSHSNTPGQIGVHTVFQSPHRSSENLLHFQSKKWLTRLSPQSSVETFRDFDDPGEFTQDEDRFVRL